MGFRSLQHLQGRKIHFTRGCRTRYGPPSGFDYPLDGLRPSSPGRLCFTPAALLGFALRSFRLPEGAPAFPQVRTHVPFFPSLFPPPKRRAGPTGRGFWALTLPRVPCDRTGVSSPATGYSHGLNPPRVSRTTTWSELLPGLLPHAWQQSTLTGRRRPRLGVSIGCHLAPPPAGCPVGSAEQPFQGLRTRTTPAFERPTTRAICFTSVPRRALLPTADTSLSSRTALP
jgi:hypothetical protein